MSHARFLRPIIATGLLCLLGAGQAQAIDKCKVKVDKKTGVVRVDAKGVDGPLTWGDESTAVTNTFFNDATCVSGTKAKRCELADETTLASKTLPAGCTLYLDDSVAPCEAWIRGCTPRAQGGGNFDEEPDLAFGLSIVPLAAGDTIVRSVAMTLPKPGIVVVNASGFFDHSGGARSTGRCELTTESTLDVLYGKTVVYVDGESGDENAIVLSRGFDVSGPGSTTYNLVCDRYSGPGDLDIVNPSLTAVYLPQIY